MRLLICILLLFTGAISFAQDIHFSHLNRQPLYQNPGNTGLFKGDIRLTGNWKDQWRNVTVPYSTFAAAIDGKLARTGLSGGLLLFYDQVGDGTLKTLEVQGSLAKQLKLSADSVHCVSVGIQVGMNYRQVNYNQFYFDNQFNGIFYDPSLPTNEVFLNASRTNFSSAAGAVYSWMPSRKEKLMVGIAGFNLNRPDQGFYGQKVFRDRRLNLFATYERPLTEQIRLLPGFSLNFQGTYRELLLGSQVRYILTERLGNYRAIDGGIWFRNKDAVVIRGGIAIQNWSLAVSYDTNISQLVPASNARGGLEISFEYIITKFNPKKIQHRVCPDFI